MRRLALRKKGYTDGNKSVVVGRDEAVKERTAEALNSGGGACEPGFRDAEDLAIAALSWKLWRKGEGMERWEK